MEPLDEKKKKKRKGKRTRSKICVGDVLLQRQERNQGYGEDHTTVKHTLVWSG